MKKAGLIILFLFLVFIIHAQSITPQLVSFCGNSISGSGYSLDYSLGELVTTTMSVSPNTLTQGILQPNYNASSGIVELESNSASVFPNPATDFVYIVVNRGTITDIAFFDLTGKMVLKTKSSPVNISALSSGIYIAVVNANEVVQRVKIVIP